MSNNFISITTILNYIEEWYPNTKFWDGYSKHEPRNKHKSYKHRQGMPNEIRIEFDGEDINENWENCNLTCINLYNAGYNFAIYYVDGGRSPHIHMYDCDEMDNLTSEKRTSYREIFLDKYCPKDSNPDKALCNEKHLCALEFVNHFKYNKPKKLLNYFWQGQLNNQSCDATILFHVPFENMFNKKEEKKFENKPLKFGETLVKNQRELYMKSLDFQSIFNKYKIKYKGTMAICPFHKDTNGSLSFNNKNKLWKCFGSCCNSQGNIIQLIKKLEELKGDNI